MAGFLFAMLAVLAAGLGGRDQLLVARLAPRGAALAIALGCALLTAAAAGWAGIKTAALLDPRGRVMLVALVLGLAALELLLIRPGRKAEEPTQSLGATALVVLAHQLTDAARLIIFAIAAANPAPWAATIGGAVGSGASLAAGWLGGAEWERQPLVKIRRGLGVLLLAVALWLGMMR